jgi:hypothetical protein
MKAQRTFPFKLWNLINSNESNGVEWSPEGTQVRINKKLFTQKCLGNYLKFKTQKFLSITKQLNVYGFVQIPHEKSANEPIFMSPNFKRDRPDLLERFTRRIAISKKSSSSHKPKSIVKNERKILAAVENVPQKIRSQPPRKATLVKKSFIFETSSSSSEKSSSIASFYSVPMKNYSPLIMAPMNLMTPKENHVTEARVRSSLISSIVNAKFFIHEK